MLTHTDSEVRSRLDPRTKLLLVLTITTVVIGGSNQGYMLLAKALISAIPLVLYLMDRRWRTAFWYTAAYLIAFWGEQVLLRRTFGVVHFILVAICMTVLRFMPGFATGAYLMRTTTVSAFLAAMDRMHLPQAITIPLAVTFRFFPTIGEEHSAIQKAMRLRGVRLGGGKPSKMLEYRLIPLIITCVNISDELSAAALTRGLGSPHKRTNICEIGFGPLDWAAFAVCFCSWGLLIFDIFVR